MRRSRSPIRFNRERSPSIVSIHSREPSRERSFSMSSLSSCSLGQPSSTNRNYQKKFLEIDRKGNQNIDQGNLDRRNKRHGKNEDSNRRYEKGRLVRKEVEERESVRGNDGNFRRFKGGKTKPLAEKMSYSGLEMSDPSVTLQEQRAFQIQSAELEFDNLNSGRLDRLENMLEQLLQKKLLQEQHQPSTSGFIPENSENPFELNPRNTTFTTSLWLNKINEECVEKNYDEKTCIQFMQSRMSGLMKAWFKTLDVFEYSWPELKMLIIRTFPDNIEFSATLKLLVDRFKQPEESITQYYFSKMYLLEACKITGANAVSCLIDGLNNLYLQQEAKVHNFLTPETLYSQFFTKLPNFGIQQSHSVSEDIPRDVNEYTETAEPSVQVLRAPKKFSSASAPKSLKKCYTCNKFGHIAVECRHAPLCYKCNKQGHIAAKCLRN